MKRPWLVYGLAFVGGLVVFILFLSLFFSFITALKDKGFGRPKIGVLEIKGVFLEADPYLPLLRELRERRDIKAVVLRIDSPGGAVGPVQELFEELKVLKKFKPLVVSMGGVAASGGLYLALPGQKIFANPGTITGSIGVMIQLPNLEKLMEKIGVSAEVIKSGEFKDTGSTFRRLSSEEKRYLQEKVNSLHEQFVRAIVEERRLSPEKVRALANGKIYTGEEAKKLGLIDELGNLSRALEVAQAMAGLKKADIYMLPPKKGLLTKLFEEKLDLNSKLIDPFNFRALYLFKN